MPRPSGTWHNPARATDSAGARVISSSRSQIRPDIGRMSPETVRSRVDFPAPFGPSRATTDPA